jgi:hypothetical protein
MKRQPGKRGRPRKQHPLTPAERMRAYRRRKQAAGYKVVSKWLPTDEDNQATQSDHHILDARSLSLHCKIKRKIDQNPDLLETPWRNLARWSESASGPVPAYINEWREILDQPWPNVAAFITSFSDKAVRLRQSSPFAGVLNPKERKQVYDAFRT